MKFFSNDAKETTEDQAHDDRDLATPGSVEAEPAAVPQQRAGSPWNDAPGTDTDLSRDDSSSSSSSSFSGDDSLRDDLARDDLRPDDSEVRTDGDEPIRSDEDSTAHTDAVDLPLDDHDETRDRADTDTVAEDQGFGDRGESGTVDSRDDVDAVDARDGFGDRDEATDAHTYGPDGTVTPVDADKTDETDDTDDTDDAVRGEGDFDSPQASEESDTHPVAGDVDEEVNDTSADFEPAEVAATPVDSTPVDSTPVDSTDADADADADAGVVPVAVPAATADKTPGSVEEPKIDRLFTDGDSFAERFRDIQLRFVDSPKEATAEAATLVGEAVDTLTSALKSQQEGLSSKSEDTEQLRVELRGYRDMLNRLTAL